MDPDDDRHEWQRRAIAVPAMVLAALAFHAWGTGHFMQRTALTMPLHEVGHAIAGWLCGFTSIPTLWKTSIPEARSWFPTLVVGGAAAALIVLGWRAERVALWASGLALAAVIFVGTVALSVDDAHGAVTFLGDGGAMILGTVLACAFFVGPDSRLRAGGLRWGLLAIGAAAFVDTFSTWWRARTQPDVIPFGEIEGVGLSDPSKLLEDHHWPTMTIVGRYVAFGVVCSLVLIARWTWATYGEYRRRRPS